MKMKKMVLGTFVLVASLGLQANAHAEECKAPGKASEMTQEQMEALYACLKPKLAQDYGRKDHEIGSAYSSWRPASLYPAAPGVHSGQHLMTYVNDIGFDQYTEYRTDGSAMPVGTVIAKESFTIKDNGKIKDGPLLIMTKVEGTENTGGWAYSGVKPNGKKLKVDGEGFCHACHQAWAHQDYQGYPVPDARVSSN